MTSQGFVLCFLIFSLVISGSSTAVVLNTAYRVNLSPAISGLAPRVFIPSADYRPDIVLTAVDPADLPDTRRIDPSLPRNPALVLRQPTTDHPFDEAAGRENFTWPVTILSGKPKKLPVRRPDMAEPVMLAAVLSKRMFSPPRFRPGGEALAALLAPVPDIRPTKRPKSIRDIVLAAFTPDQDLEEELAQEEKQAALNPVAITEPLPETTPEATTPRDSPFRLGAGDTCNRRLARAIPRRAGKAPEGSAFISKIGERSGGARDRLITAQIMAGNVPDYLRRLVPVRMTGRDDRGNPAAITICVTPDYLALGSDRDNIRVPLGLDSASAIASRFDMVLPTTRMVDAIYAQATVRLTPRPKPAGARMSTTTYFREHDATIDAQTRAVGARGGMLIAGHKKDIVLTNRLARAPGRIAIYGWHRSNGNPIQPLSTVHGKSYADYSHGLRLVSRTAYVNGKPVDLKSLLSDRRYAGILNKEGTLSATAFRIASR